MKPLLESEYVDFSVQGDGTRCLIEFSNGHNKTDVTGTGEVVRIIFLS